MPLRSNYKRTKSPQDSLELRRFEHDLRHGTQALVVKVVVALIAAAAAIGSTYLALRDKAPAASTPIASSTSSAPAPPPAPRVEECPRATYVSAIPSYDATRKQAKVDTTPRLGCAWKDLPSDQIVVPCALVAELCATPDVVAIVFDNSSDVSRRLGMKEGKLLLAMAASEAKSIERVLRDTTGVGILDSGTLFSLSLQADHELNHASHRFVGVRATVTIPREFPGLGPNPMDPGLQVPVPGPTGPLTINAPGISPLARANADNERLAQRKEWYRKCWEHRGVAGTVYLAITIDEGGRVQVDAAPRGAVPGDIVECVKSKARAIPFQKVPGRFRASSKYTLQEA